MWRWRCPRRCGLASRGAASCDVLELPPPSAVSAVQNAAAIVVDSSRVASPAPAMSTACRSSHCLRALLFAHLLQRLHPPFVVPPACHEPYAGPLVFFLRGSRGSTSKDRRQAVQPPGLQDDSGWAIVKPLLHARAALPMREKGTRAGPPEWRRAWPTHPRLASRSRPLRVEVLRDKSQKQSPGSRSHMGQADLFFWMVLLDSATSVVQPFFVYVAGSLTAVSIAAHSIFRDQPTGDAVRLAKNRRAGRAGKANQVIKQIKAGRNAHTGRGISASICPKKSSRRLSL